MSQETKKTTDHKTIKEWAEQRDAKPAVVTKDGKETELLRLDFPGYAEDNLKEVDWDTWFKLFDENKLEMAYQEETKDGEKSNFNKLVNREN